MIRIETGPCPGAPYSNWKFWEISDAAMADQGVFEQEMHDLKDFLSDVDSGVDPFGPFADQVEGAVLAMIGEVVSRDGAESAPKQRSLMLAGTIYIKDKNGYDTPEIDQNFDLDVRIVWRDE